MKQRYLNSKIVFILSTLFFLDAEVLLPQIDWIEYSSNPIIQPTTGWESGVVLTPAVIKHGDTLKMWYTGTTSLFNPSSIGYAWSLDEITWTRYGGNPVMSGRSGEWDDQGIAMPVMISDGDTLRMWYGGGGLSPDEWDLGYAVSVNGINWARFPNPVLQRGVAGEWNADVLTTGGVIKEKGIYKMWFTGGIGSVSPANQNTKTSIGYATSTDGLDWTIYDDPTTTTAPYEFSDPVIEHGESGEWDSNETLSSSVIKTINGYQLWYSGWIAGSSQNIGYATSLNGIEWVKHTNNPVFNAPETWTNLLVFPSVLLDNNEYRMWFQGWQGGTASIGYATSSVTNVNEESYGYMIKDFILYQNYPNPFNPQTVISYKIRARSNVVIKINDVLGKEISTLVNEEKNAGTYEVTFNGDELPSGIYYYKIIIGNFSDTKKMILLK